MWAASHETASQELMPVERERMLPSASMHLVFRFSDRPIHIFRSITDSMADTFSCGAVCGIRSSYCVKDIAPSASTVGAALRPGACEALFGIPAEGIAGRHVALEDLWGSAARSLYEELEGIADFECRLQVFESFLLKRVPRVAGMHPAIAHALSRLSTSADIGNIVEETGYSHRHFIKLFRETVGVAPRLYTRLLRFQQTLKFGVDKSRGRWIDVALEAGYADQSHFNREFRELTGLSPTEYLLDRRASSHHVPISRQFRSRRHGDDKR
jgi:AraC-like DNA-binding protein